jgi:hypothetical protein
LKLHTVVADAIRIRHPARKVQGEGRQIFHLAICRWRRLARGWPGYFFLRCCSEISPIPSHSGHTFPSFRPLPRQTGHRIEPCSFELDMLVGKRNYSSGLQRTLLENKLNPLTHRQHYTDIQDCSTEFGRQFHFRATLLI